MPHTSTKTSVIILQKYFDDADKIKKFPVFMAKCETCGHDRRGNTDDCEDDISEVAKSFLEWRISNGITF